MFAVLKTVLIAVMPDATLVPTIVKVAAAIVLVLFALTGKPLQKGFFHRLLFIGLLFFLMADIAIKLRASIGVLLFGIGHLLLVIAFFKKKKPTKIGVLIWVVASVAVGFCMFFFLHGIIPAGYLGCACVTAYGAILILMVVCATRMPKTLSIAAYAFILSDLLLGADKISPKLVWCHCISTALFYLSLWLICYFLADKSSDNGMTAS